MQQKILAFIMQQKMIEKNDHVIVACSGGADSVCLLRVLTECRKKLDFSLSVVHVEHGIRGEESIRDAAFTEELCRTLAVPFVLCPVDAPSYAARQRMGLEEAARALRYEALKDQAQKTAASVKIALAHHMEDNAETILFQMARGSGLAGLCGIRPVRTEGAVTYIRPLLCVTRPEIEAWLKERGQTYCTDGTNQDETYSRNRIRKSILPQLASVNEQAVWHMNRAAEKICEAYDFIRECAEIQYRDIVTDTAPAAAVSAQGSSAGRLCGAPGHPGCLCASVSRLRALHPAVRGELLRLLLFEAAGHRKDIASVHVEALDGLLTLQSGRRLALPYGITASREYDTLFVYRNAGDGAERKDEEEVLVAEEALLSAAEDGMWFTIREFSDGAVLRARVWKTVSPLEEIAKKPYTKQFDYDKIKSGFSVRKRRKGDYFVLDAEGHRKKLSDYMVNEKIPAHTRADIPLLAQGNEVIWLIGWRIGASCMVSGDTTRIMEIEYDGGMSDGL